MGVWDGPVRTRFMARASWGVVCSVRVLSACNLTPQTQIVIESEESAHLNLSDNLADNF